MASLYVRMQENKTTRKSYKIRFPLPCLVTSGVISRKSDLSFETVLKSSAGHTDAQARQNQRSMLKPQCSAGVRAHCVTEFIQSEDSNGKHWGNYKVNKIHFLFSFDASQQTKSQIVLQSAAHPRTKTLRKITGYKTPIFLTKCISYENTQQAASWF